MGNEDHLRNAGRSVAKGTRNAVDSTSEGRVLDATESAWEGTATAAREVGKSAVKNTANLFQGPNENQE